MSAIQAAVKRAMETRRWSVAKVADAIGLHHSSLDRWLDGTTRSYDISALIKLFELAGLSMDQAFGLAASTTTVPVLTMTELDAIRERIESLEKQVSLSPMQQLFTAILAQSAPIAAPPPIVDPTPESRRISGATRGQRAKLTQNEQEALDKLAREAEKQPGQRRKTGGG